ncbi:hypothetical protein F1C16_22550 (plasmid) [Hymenobacter sp. NBH84]|uniref:hypothetical protein n=1 Tax=Hymenobacter sp. NBH84 TaxID=2596915 RepID=UPI001626661E|nr:hypothetical protein [Hymenobacter sp. NBH84]QNE42400.1 hypothetical protein F1C16_22550 [Hymenobacter sp. NBH84]
MSYDAPALHFSRQNRYTWVYDSLDRVQTYYSYDGQRLIWVERYTYFPAGYGFTRTWYDADGNPTHAKPEEQQDGPEYTFIRYQNRNGQVERGETVTAHGDVLNRRRLYYNGEQQLVRTVCENGQGEPQLTHVYVYQ